MRREIRVEWGDCDPAQIVFYPGYLAFFDASTAWLFEAAGIPKTELLRQFDIVGPPRVPTRCSRGPYRLRSSNDSANETRRE